MNEHSESDEDQSDRHNAKELLRRLAKRAKPEPKPLILEDSQGRRLTRDEVFERAVQEVQNAYTHDELARMYLENESDDDLIQWVTGGEGSFQFSDEHD